MDQLKELSQISKIETNINKETLTIKYAKNHTFAIEKFKPGSEIKINTAAKINNSLLAMELLLSYIPKDKLSLPITMLISRILTTNPNLIEFLNPKNLIPEKIRPDANRIIRIKIGKINTIKFKTYSLFEIGDFVTVELEDKIFNFKVIDIVVDCECFIIAQDIGYYYTISEMSNEDILKLKGLKIKKIIDKDDIKRIAEESHLL